MSQLRPIPVATAAAAASVQFTPAQDQSKVSHLRITITRMQPLPDGSIGAHVTCGDIGFRLVLPCTDASPTFEVGHRYTLEYPKGTVPFNGHYTAIYPTEQKPAPEPRSSSMNALITTNTQTVTMSSLEMVEYINSTRKAGEATLAHSDFLKKVPQVLGSEVAGKFSCYYTAANGKRNPCYRFPKREACLMAMSYSYELQAKVYDKMTALEQAQTQQPAIPQTLPEALRLAADLAEQLTLAAPKAAALDRISKTEGSMCITDAAKTLGIQPKALFKWLSEHLWIYRRAGNSHWIAYQNRIQTGVMEQKATVITKSDGTEKTIEQALVTAKGIARLSELMGAAA